MSIRTKAAIETAKLLAALIAGGVAMYFLLDILGPKVGLVFILLGMIGGFAWTAYDYFVHKYTLQDKWKL